MPRTNPNQLAFAFPEPRLSWALPWEGTPVAAPVRAVVLPAPVVDARGVVDFQPAVEMMRRSSRYHGGCEGYAACTRDLAVWHGCPDDDGIYRAGDEVEVARVGADVSVHAFLASTGRGHWITGHRLRCGTSGWSAPATVWAASGGVTREAALGDLARRAARIFANEAVSTSSVVTNKTKSLAAVMATRLQAYGNEAVLRACSAA